MKRFLILVAVLIFVGLVLGAGYYFRYQGTGPEEPPDGESGEDGEIGGILPPIGGNLSTSTPAAAGEEKRSSDEAVAFYALDSRTQLLVAPDGRILKNLPAKTETLSSAPISDVGGAAFSYNGSRVVVWFGSPVVQYAVFDTATKIWQSLPANIEAVAWSPSDLRLAYFVNQGDAPGLSIWDLSSSRNLPRLALRLRFESPVLAWPAANRIMIGELPSLEQPGSLLSYDPRAGSLSVVMQDQAGLWGIWNKDATRGVVWQSDRRGGRLSLVDGAGNLLRRFSLLTLPSKCGFGEAAVSSSSSTPSASTSTLAGTATSTASGASQKNEFLFCGVPRGQEFSRALLPDDYLKRALYTSDDIFRIDFRTGEIRSISLGQKFDVENPRVFGDRLYFINRLDRKVYSLPLD